MIVYTSTWFLVAIYLLSILSVWQSGAWFPSVYCLTIHYIVHMVICATSLGIKRLGTWQVSLARQVDTHTHALRNRSARMRIVRTLGGALSVHLILDTYSDRTKAVLKVWS